MQVVYLVGGRTRLPRYLDLAFKENKMLLDCCKIGIPNKSTLNNQVRQQLASASSTDLLPSNFVRSINDYKDLTRLIAVNEHFLASPNSIFESEELYPRAEVKISSLGEIFKGHQLTIVLSIESLATFFNNSPNSDLTKTLFDTPLESILRSSWYEIAQSFVELVPTANLLVVVSETAPIYFEEIFRAVTGLSDGTEIRGVYRFLKQSLTKAGQKKLANIIAGECGDWEEMGLSPASSLLLQYRRLDSSNYHNLDKIWNETFMKKLDTQFREDIEDLRCLERTTVIGNYWNDIS